MSASDTTDNHVRAASVTTPCPDDPAAALTVGPHPAPSPREGWTRLRVRAAALNMHDVWMLRGIAPLPGNGPCILGSDAAGVVGDREVIVYPVAPPPSEGSRPRTTVSQGVLLSDIGHGLLAEEAVVPTGHVVDKPAHLTWPEAAALPTAWLTAYRMLHTQGRLRAGDTVLIQGAGGGVATAAIVLAKALGASVIATSRSAQKRDQAIALGADLALATGERLPDLADVVIETVGPATFDHSLASTAVGGRVVVCGASTGFQVELNLARLFAREISVQGSTMGTLQEFTALMGLVDQHQLRPAVDSTVPLDQAPQQVRRMLSGEAYGKLVVSI
ncbi:zinc-binding dehydrogenase [Nocardioides daejeonensis]|uniref:zinc-binding dehydrogenase n=1 Tax=Nocardioides daejeonensis TaxID=1046556 RepID=UPI000D743FB7|nr:zinc-binding dehydrogenase [Nocardioides daejeonensis]